MATSSLIRWHSRGLKTQLRDDRKSGGASHSSHSGRELDSAVAEICALRMESVQPVGG